MKIRLLGLLRKLLVSSRQPWATVVRLLGRLIQRLLSNPQIAELWRFIFLGSLVETGRIVGQKVVDAVSGFFVTTASFTSGDFAYDWVKVYLESYHIWDQSHSFNVVAKNTAFVPNPSSVLGSTDGHPDPVYEPAHQAPEVFRWHGYLISVSREKERGLSGNDTLVLRMWSYNRNVLNDFVCAAREFYIDSDIPPRITDPVQDSSSSLLRAYFQQDDWSYDWILAYLRSENILHDTMEFSITTKQSDVGWGNPKDAVRFRPAENIQQMFQYHSARTGRRTWLQITISYGYRDHNVKNVGGMITITLYSSHKAVLDELIDEARIHYLQASVSQVTLHMTDGYSWTKTMTKARRSLSTLILRNGIKENLLADVREFLDSEEWYTLLGIPHRRGYLLYGKPGTGKTSTIHAIAGELGLEIYDIPLSNPAIDDHSLARIISDTPARCILLLEDLDCAFLHSRDEDLDDETGKDPLNAGYVPPKSNVTLSGLLNVLDSMSSEEGRITFATTNYIENLDPALIRPGRMDVKIQYKLATTKQVEQVFKRFYPAERFVRPQPLDAFSENNLAPVLPPEGIPITLKLDRYYSPEELDDLAIEFAKLTADETYSVAELQGYLLNKKWDPQGAVDDLPEWMKAQEEEMAMVEEAKLRKRLQAAQRRKAAKELYDGQSSSRGFKENIQNEENEESHVDVYDDRGVCP